MSINSIQISEPRKTNYGKMIASGVAGAAVGAGARYAIPTKAELSSMLNKDAVDSFISNASTQARSANRSILKYAGLGGLIAIALGALSKIFPKTDNKDNEYTKYGALLDAPDYAVEIMWYGE